VLRDIDTQSATSTTWAIDWWIGPEVLTACLRRYRHLISQEIFQGHPPGGYNGRRHANRL